MNKLLLGLLLILVAVPILYSTSRPVSRAVPVASDQVTTATPYRMFKVTRPQRLRDFAADTAIDASLASNRQFNCLAQAVYFEARSEPLTGQLAVAQVVLNRMDSPAYPDTVCGVVFQNERWRHRCQFSFACDGKSDRPRNLAAWQTAQQIAQLAYDGDWPDVTGGSTHYHADYVQPDWRLAMEKTVRHGRHLFYRDNKVVLTDD